jgi:hypothetical protein
LANETAPAQAECSLHSITFRHREIPDKFPRTLTNALQSARIEGVLPKSGPVAQLGARFHGMEEVIGSIPIRSTNQFNNVEFCHATALTPDIFVGEMSFNDGRRP